MTEIEAFADFWGRSIDGHLEKGGQTAQEHVGRLYDVRKKIGY